MPSPDGASGWALTEELKGHVPEVPDLKTSVLPDMQRTRTTCLLTACGQSWCACALRWSRASPPGLQTLPFCRGGLGPFPTPSIPPPLMGSRTPIPTTCGFPVFLAGTRVGAFWKSTLFSSAPNQAPAPPPCASPTLPGPSIFLPPFLPWEREPSLGRRAPAMLPCLCQEEHIKGSLSSQGPWRHPGTSAQTLAVGKLSMRAHAHQPITLSVI